MKRNKSNGRLEEVYTHDLFISVINTRMTAGEIADKIGCNKTVATRKLKDLLYAGKINGEKVAGRWVFWPVTN
jgi:predicted transcriptional regulator